MNYFPILRPTKQKKNAKQVYGYDIETYGPHNDFYCGTLYSKNFCKTFFNKHDVIDYIQQRRFRNCYIVATNLEFDFFGTFRNTDQERYFKPFYRGSSLLWVTGHQDNKGLFTHKKGSGCHPLTFLDTLNFALLSVEKLGSLINIPKLDKPKALGRLPENQEEKDELVTYNIRDAEISYKALLFLFDGFYTLGASPKRTLASTSMSLFRNKYLKEDYIVHYPNELRDQLQGYYGGRTEAFARGSFTKYKYYDFNSLYPAMMTKAFPDPNSKKVYRGNRQRFIDDYEGVSYVSLKAPEMKYPLLPYRGDHKLLFPVGTFKGWYNHVELRKAQDLGYTILETYKGYHFKDMITPFKDFVEDLYHERRRYQKEKSPMQFVTKILLNTLYGKFCQGFDSMEDYIHMDNVTYPMTQLEGFERIGDYARIKKTGNTPAPCCMPIWGSYVTSYGRILLHDHIQKAKPLYCDTDSIITKHDFETSSKLGKLKLESTIQEGIIVKPKMYAFRNDIGETAVRVKGLPRMDYNEFKLFIRNPEKTFQRFIKFKESLRRKIPVNAIIDITKEYSLEDNKRNWGQPFNRSMLQDSIARRVDRGVIAENGT